MSIIAGTTFVMSKSVARRTALDILRTMHTIYKLGAQPALLNGTLAIDQSAQITSAQMNFAVVMIAVTGHQTILAPQKRNYTPTEVICISVATTHNRDVVYLLAMLLLQELAPVENNYVRPTIITNAKARTVIILGTVVMKSLIVANHRVLTAPRLLERALQAQNSEGQMTRTNVVVVYAVHRIAVLQSAANGKPMMEALERVQLGKPNAILMTGIIARVESATRTSAA